MNKPVSKKRRWQKRFSIGFGIFSSVLFTLFIVFLLVNRSFAAQVADQLIESLLSVTTLSFLAVLLSYKRPENTISWLFVVVAFMRQAGIARAAMEMLFTRGIEPTFWLLSGGNLWFWWSALTYTILAYAIVLFPTGRLPSSRWKAATWLLGLQIILTAGLVIFLTVDLFQAFRAAVRDLGAISLTPLVESNSPFSLVTHVRSIPEVMLLGNIMALIALILVLLGLLSQIGRYRHGSSLERQQIKWVGFGLILWIFGLIVIIFPTGLPVTVLVYTSPFIPITIAIAILRYRLFDIDLIIRGTLVYGALTTLLIVIYFGTVTLLQSLFTAISSQSSPIVIVISTLIIAALFSPLRRRIQQLIDRRFYRRKYNAERILSGFAETARDEVNLEELTAELLHVTQESLQPGTVCLWLGSGPVEVAENKM